MATSMSSERPRRERPGRVVSPDSPVATLVHDAAVTVPHSCPISEAVEVMRLAEVSALLVGEDNAIVTERDVARALAAERDANEPVDAIATPHPVVVSGTTSVLAAAELMLTAEVRHLIVMRDVGGAGLVSMRDLLAVLVQVADPETWLPALRRATEPPTELWLG